MRRHRLQALYISFEGPILVENFLLSAKDRIKRLTASNPLLEQLMFRYYRVRNGAAVERELARRAQLDLFDLEALAAPLPYGPEERVIDNNLYGYASHLKHYAGIKQDLKAYMEHGLFLGGIIHPDQFHWHFSRFITMSSARKALLEERFPEKATIAIGPYIHYAQSILESKEQEKLKKQLGKTLLVYPFHSMKNVEAGFNEPDLIRRIKEVARDFDTVLISLFYLDAYRKDTVAAYEAEGFKVITAGHRYDRHFVARQRCHIELADLTMSNGMGTQTGFCVYLNKPHYIYQQQIEQKAHNQKELKRFKAGGSAGSVRERVAQERAFFSGLFAELRDDLSAEQKEVTADFWGFDQIKQVPEIQAFFQ